MCKELKTVDLKFALKVNGLNENFILKMFSTIFHIAESWRGLKSQKELIYFASRKPKTS